MAFKRITQHDMGTLLVSGKPHINHHFTSKIPVLCQIKCPEAVQLQGSFISDASTPTTIFSLFKRRSFEKCGGVSILDSITSIRPVFKSVSSVENTAFNFRYHQF